VLLQIDEIKVTSQTKQKKPEIALRSYYGPDICRLKL